MCICESIQFPCQINGVVRCDGHILPLTWCCMMLVLSDLNITIIILFLMQTKFSGQIYVILKSEQYVKISTMNWNLCSFLHPAQTRVIPSICDKPLSPDQLNWSFLELSCAMLLSAGVCWCDCAMIMKLGPQKPVSVTEWSPEGFCHHPHSSQRWCFLSLHLFSLSPLSPLPVPAFAFVPFQLFINTWWMPLCKKVSLKSFSLSHDYFLHPCSTPTAPIAAALSLAVTRFLMQVICQTPTFYYLLPL